MRQKTNERDERQDWSSTSQAIRKAVDDYRELYAADPEMYREELAESLSEREIYLLKLERWEEARAAATEAVGLYRQMHASDPDTYRPKLVSSLYSLSASLRRLECWDDARQTDIESLSLFDITGQISHQDRRVIGRGGYGTVYEAHWIKKNTMRVRWEPEARKRSVCPTMAYVCSHVNAAWTLCYSW